jgi:hypothetical protein
MRVVAGVIVVLLLSQAASSARPPSMRRVSSSACNIRAQSQVDGLLAAMNAGNGAAARARLQRPRAPVLRKTIGTTFRLSQSRRGSHFTVTEADYRFDRGVEPTFHRWVRNAARTSSFRLAAFALGVLQHDQTAGFSVTIARTRRGSDHVVDYAGKGNFDCKTGRIFFLTAIRAAEGA